MYRTFSTFAVALLVLLIPAQLVAGGPARLCLPISGVTVDNAPACAEILAAGLGEKLWSHAAQGAVTFEQHQGQWYALFYLAPKSHVKLSDVDAALEGSQFSVPHERLHFFGAVQLDVHVRPAAHEALLKDLAALQYVEIEESSRTDGGLLITAILPENGRRNIFQLLNDSPPESNASAPSINAESLPSYAALRDVMVQHDARLSDMRWSGRWVCRMSGSLTVDGDDGKPRKVAVSGVGGSLRDPQPKSFHLGKD